MIRIAHETLRKMEEMVECDQGSAYRGWLGKVIGHIGDAYRTGEDGHRTHMGASIIGGECPRAIWYNFRWATKPRFSGRILRLFNRGHLEEARFIALLLTIGCQVYQQDANGNQFRITASEGHFGGSSDGIVVGLSEVDAAVQALTEMKTHGDTSFKEVKAKGVKAAKFEHYVQMNVYMRKMGIPVCLYLAVNKNTDEIYAEIVVLDAEVADQFLARGDKLIWMRDPPSKINNSPGFYKCRFCDHSGVCHKGAAPDRNCRTCVFSAPGPSATWQCSGPDALQAVPELAQSIPKELQLKGCAFYTARKDM